MFLHPSRWAAPWLYVATAVAIAVPFLVFGLHDGLPLLRHDWGLPATAAGWKAFAVTSVSGWDTGGIGSPRPYPTLFALGPLLAAVGLVFGSVGALAAFLIAIAGAFVAAGARIGANVARNRWFGLVLGGAMLYNPWVYEKLVAGHLAMLLAAGTCALLASELLSDHPRRWVVAICSFIAAFQIQFGLLVIPLALVIRPDRRTTAIVAAGSFASLLPSLVGIAFSQSTLAGIPYTDTWQYANSVQPPDEFLLDGYSPGYTSGSHLIFVFSMLVWLVAALAGVGFGIQERRHRALTIRIATGALLVLLFSTGLRGALEPIYALSLHVRSTLVFRELYDLLGIIVLLYATLAALAMARRRFIGFTLAAAACGLIAAWVVAPPWSWWTPSANVPRITVETSVPNARFALLPWRQPLQLNGAGSGADPDNYGRENNVVPLNQYSDSYPSDLALDEYQRSGDARDLEALSVSRVYDRPYFSSDDRAIQDAVPTATSATPARRGGILRAQPELSLGDVPATGTIPLPVRDVYLFFGGDQRAIASDLRPVAAPLVTTDPAHGWVDASLFFSQYPEVATALGGAFTLDPTASLAVPVPGPRRALVFVKGALLTAGRVLATGTRGWEWVDVSGATALECRGECAVIAWEVRPFPGPSGPAKQPAFQPIDFDQVSPFLATGTLPAAQGSRLLLYRTRFDSAWLLFGVPNRHVAVSNVFNGYIVSPGSSPAPFALVEVTAVIQLFAMFISLAGIVVLVAPRGRKRASRAPS